MRTPATQRIQVLVLVAFAAVALAGGAARGQELDPQRMAAVKAGMVVNFLRYTTWPAAAFKDAEAPIVVAIVGDSDVDRSLPEAVEGQAIGGRAVEVRRLRYPRTHPGEAAPRAEEVFEFNRDLRSAHAAYFGRSERERYRGVLKDLGAAPVLTIGEVEGFAERGGMLGLAVRERKVAFDANEDAIKAAGLRVSSQVLKLARRVQSSAGGGGGRQ